MTKTQNYKFNYPTSLKNIDSQLSFKFGVKRKVGVLVNIALFSLLASQPVFAIDTIELTNNTPLHKGFLGKFDLIDIGPLNGSSVTVWGNSVPPSTNPLLLTLNTNSNGKSYSLTLKNLSISSAAANNAFIATVMTSQGEVSGNHLEIDSSTTALEGVGNIFGGFTENGAANMNKVTIRPLLNIKQWEANNITGGYAQEGGDASSNIVTIEGNVNLKKVSGGELLGHQGGTFSANSNRVELNGEGRVTSLYGGYAPAYGNTRGNSVEVVFNGSVTELHGGRTHDGNSSDNSISIRSPSSLTGTLIQGGSGQFVGNNTVTIEKGAALTFDSIVGGFSDQYKAQVHFNTVEVFGGTQIGEIIGGSATAGGDSTQNNIVNIDAENLSINRVIGGSSSETFGNQVILVKAKAEEVIGGRANNRTGRANLNIVLLEDATGRYVYGGKSGDEAWNNKVILANSKIESGGVYGGYVGPNGNRASNNLVQLNGANYIDGNIFGAYSEKASLSSTMTDNSVYLKGNITVTGAIYAAQAAGNGPIGDHNALVFEGQISAGKIDGFTDLHLIVRDENLVSNAGSYLLTITGTDSLDLRGKNIAIYDYRGNPTDPSGEKFGLIKMASPGNSLQLGNNITLYNTFLNKDWKVTTENADELFIMDGKLVILNPTPNNPGNTIVINPTIATNVNSQSLSQNRLASIASLNQSALFAAESGLNAMKDQLYGKNWFFAGQGGMNKYGHGFNKIELNGGSVITGMMNNFDGTLLGGFFEASWGHAGSKESVFSAKSNIQSYGLGVLASREIYPNWEVDGSLRFGWMRNSFKGRYFDVDGSSDFKTNMAYVSGHIGTAYNFSVSDETTISPYARYIVSYLGSDKVNAGSVEEDLYKANATVSHTLRAGVKVNTQISENFKFVGGVAVDETMGAKAKGRVSGYDLKTLSVNGTTAVGELKLQAVPSSTSPWKFELGVNGYAGRRRGFSGEASVNYRF